MNDEVADSKDFPQYIGVRSTPVHHTTELVPGAVFADFDEEGNLLGVEVLGDGKENPVYRSAAAMHDRIRELEAQLAFAEAALKTFSENQEAMRKLAE